MWNWHEKDVSYCLSLCHKEGLEIFQPILWFFYPLLKLYNQNHPNMLSKLHHVAMVWQEGGFLLLVFIVVDEQLRRQGWNKTYVQSTHFFHYIFFWWGCQDELKYHSLRNCSSSLTQFSDTQWLNKGGALLLVSFVIDKQLR